MGTKADKSDLEKQVVHDGMEALWPSFQNEQIRLTEMTNVS